MARTAIPVAQVASFLQGEGIVATAGDAANDHEVSLLKAPKLHLIAQNTNASAVAFSIELPAGNRNFKQATTISKSIAASAIEVFVLDVPSGLAQTGNVLHIDSADGNFGDVNFWAYTWSDTPWAGGGARYNG